MLHTDMQATRLRIDLSRRKDELEDLLNRIRDNYARGLDPDSEERAVQVGNRDVVDSLGKDAVGELMSIRAALGRLDCGRYGTCITCGNIIDERRLAAQPCAAECIGCARARESDQVLQSA